MARFVVLASLLCVPAIGTAQPTPVAPTGCPPVVVMAKAHSNDGKVELLVEVPVTLAEEVRKKVLVMEGNVVKEIEVSTVIVKTIIEKRTFVVDGNKVSVMRQNLKEVAARDLPGLLAKPTAAVMFCGKPAPYYTQVLRADVLVISVPEMQPVPVPSPDKEFPKPPPAPKKS